MKISFTDLILVTRPRFHADGRRRKKHRLIKITDDPHPRTPLRRKEGTTSGSRPTTIGKMRL